jgi:hypothetical protein
MTMASLHLRRTAIIVDFQVEFNNSGEVLTAVVPFRRQASS